MFGKYFKHVLVLTLLAGFSYSLPQVRVSMIDAFAINTIDEAAIFNSTSTRNFNDIRKEGELKREIGQKQVQNMNIRMIPPEELLKVLIKEGIIDKDKEEIAVKVLKKYIETRQASTSMMNRMPPINSMIIKDAKLNRDNRENKGDLERPKSDLIKLDSVDN